MKRSLLALVLAAFCAATLAQQPRAIPDTDFGLQKGAVADALQPKPFEFKDGYDITKPVPGSGMPPMIPHTIDDSIPITVANNDCLGCHKAPGGGRKSRGPSTPESHWATIEGKPELAGRRYVCTACHAPQADVAPLVRNEAR